MTFHPEKNGRRYGTPDFDDIRSFQTVPHRDFGPVVAVAMLGVASVLFALAMIAVSMGQARADRPSFCDPFPSAVECIAAAQEIGQ